MPFLSKTTVISRFKCSVLRVLVSIYVHLQFEISIRTIRSLLVACEAPRRLKKKKKIGLACASIRGAACHYVGEGRMIGSQEDSKNFP